MLKEGKIETTILLHILNQTSRKGFERFSVLSLQTDKGPASNNFRNKAAF
jgi:hypothetical protein